MLAAANGLTSLVRKCVRQGIVDNRSIHKRDRNGKSALTLALRNEYYNCAREIPDNNKRTPREIKELNAALHGIFEGDYKSRDCLIQVLECMGATETPLVGVVINGLEKLTLDLISHGFDIRLVDKDGLTVLMAAAERGLYRLVKLCFEVGSE